MFKTRYIKHKRH